ncbi:Shikimate dehydrogenase (NADP(+)) [subsurface metagenome]
MKIGGKTKIVGIFGYPLAHSLSPHLHNAAFALLGLDFVYLPFRVQSKNLDLAARAIKSLNIVGVNVTIPHKEEIIAYLDEVTPEARMMGAVNTVSNRKGRLIGYNTDGQGFIDSLKKEGRFDPRGKRVMLLGAGGAARAISSVLIRQGIASLIIVNRTQRRGEELAHHLKRIFKNRCPIDLLEFNQRSFWGGVREINLFVNATSVGMHPEDHLLINLDLFSPDTFVYDVVYNRKTELLEAAEEQDLPCLGGLGMLIHQAALSFEIWTHRKAPLQKMREAVEKELGMGKRGI